MDWNVADPGERDPARCGDCRPLLANLYLHPLDLRMMAMGYRMVRYADDFVVLCRNAEEAEAALVEIQAWVDANGLRLHPDKTHVADSQQPRQGFDFLGYRFEAGKRRVRKKSLKKFKNKIREKTRRTRGISLQQMVDELNPMLRGGSLTISDMRVDIFSVL